MLPGAPLQLTAGPCHPLTSQTTHTQTYTGTVTIEPGERLNLVLGPNGEASDGQEGLPVRSTAPGRLRAEARGLSKRGLPPTASAPLPGGARGRGGRKHPMRSKWHVHNRGALMGAAGTCEPLPHRHLNAVRLVRSHVPACLPRQAPASHRSCARCASASAEAPRCATQGCTSLTRKLWLVGTCCAVTPRCALLLQPVLHPQHIASPERLRCRSPRCPHPSPAMKPWNYNTPGTQYAVCRSPPHWDQSSAAAVPSSSCNVPSFLLCCMLCFPMCCAVPCCAPAAGPR